VYNKQTKRHPRIYTNNTIVELFRGFDGVFEFERVEGQISSMFRTHTFTLT